MASIINCPACNGKVSDQAAACPHCGQPMAKRCPKCGSKNVERISGASKGLNAVMWGAFAANTIMNDFRCKQCGTKFK